MKVTSGKLTVYFDEPFWTGIFERFDDGKLYMCRVVFGTEPKDGEIWQFILREYDGLRFSPPVDAVMRRTAKNPKQIQRELSKQSVFWGMSTKSQQALQLQHEENKAERKAIGKERRNAEKEHQFELKQLKRKEKHRGR